MKKLLLSGTWILILLIQNVLANNVTKSIESLKNRTDNIYWMTVIIFTIVMFYVVIYFVIKLMNYIRDKKEEEL